MRRFAGVGRAAARSGPALESVPGGNEPVEDDLPEPDPYPEPESEPEPEPLVIEPADAGDFARIETFSGRWAVTTVAASFATDVTLAACMAPYAESVTLTIDLPVQPTSTRQMLTWAGTGEPDVEVTVNGLAPEVLHLDDTGPLLVNGFPIRYWQATAAVPPSESGTYEVAGMSTDNSYEMCVRGATVGVVALTTYFEHETLPERVVSLATGLVPLHATLDTAATMTPSPTGAPAEVYVLALEGDGDLADPEESAWWGDMRLDDGSPLWSGTDEVGCPVEGFDAHRWHLPPWTHPAPVQLRTGADLILVSMVAVFSDL